MSISGAYYKDIVKVQIYRGLNDRGDTQYDSECQIFCRMDYEQKETVDSKGNKIISTATMLTDTYIPSLSIIYDEFKNRFTVKSCKVVKRLSGKPDHYEVVL